VGQRFERAAPAANRFADWLLHHRLPWPLHPGKTYSPHGREVNCGMIRSAYSHGDVFGFRFFDETKAHFSLLP
jgi:hypothetical protein